MATNGETESYPAPESSDGSHSFLLSSYLDEVEDSVEALRRKAHEVLQERDSLLTILSQLQAESLKLNGSVSEGECQEILINIERLKQRCLNIEIKIHTVRTPEQESSYSKVNSLVRGLEHLCLDGDPKEESYQHQAKNYLNACISDNLSGGTVDYKFQGLILGCKLEDQKNVRQRLECLVKGRCHENYFEEVLQSDGIPVSTSDSRNPVSSPPNDEHNKKKSENLGIESGSLSHSEPS